MELTTLDWAIVVGYFALALVIGLWASRDAGKNAKSFFLAGRNMPWWLLGISMVATTFSTDTPNLVTGLVREQGVSGNWGWWAFLLTGMLTAFVYARLWHRSGVLTDIEFYELRYGGKPAAVLRGFRALYLGLVFNVLVMGTVSLAAIKLVRVPLRPTSPNSEANAPCVRSVRHGESTVPGHVSSLCRSIIEVGEAMLI